MVLVGALRHDRMMSAQTTPGARAVGDSRRQPWQGAVRRMHLTSDPYLFYTASLVPIAVAVAFLGREDGHVGAALAVGIAVVGIQALLGSIGRRRRYDHRVAWQLLRLLPALIFVALVSRLIGGPALPLISLYIPVVAAAAAAGRVQGLAAAAVAAVVLVGPELGHLGSPNAIALRSVTIAGVTVLVGFGTRRIVRALEEALVAARAAVVAERRRGRQIAALESVGSLLAAGGLSNELLAEVAELVATRFGYPHVSIYLGDSTAVRLAASSGYVDPLPGFDASSGVAGRVMRSSELAWVPDVTRDPDYIPAALDATSLICAPLIVDGQLLGVLNVETSGGRVLDRTDRSLVVIIAGRIASAIALGEERQGLAARADLFRDLEAFGRDVSSSLAIEPLAEATVAAAARVVQADVLAVTLLDRESGRYVVRGGRGVPTGVIGREIEVGEGLAGRAIRDRTPVVENGFEVDRFPRSVQESGIAAFVHGVGLPLIRDGVVVGAFTVGRTGEGAEAFSELEMLGIQLLASNAALAVANAFLHADVGELAIRDSLTGLYNRRHFDEALDRMLAAHRRDRLSAPRTLSAIMFDLDRFGLFNKEHGHQVGDQVLKVFAGVLTSRFRAGDLVARLGGEEFVVVLDGSTLEEAVRIADEVRGLLAASTVRSDDGAQLSVTVSAGCAELDSAEPTRESLLRTADVALFMAKRAGRDRVVAA